MKDLYDTTRKLTERYKQTDKPIKDKQGKTLTTTEEQLERWAEHFNERLNRPAPEDLPDIPPAAAVLPIKCGKPSRLEIKEQMKILKNRKASGPDGVPAETLKVDITTTTEILCKLFGEIWKKEEVPKDWKEGLLVKLPKKGDLWVCSNYRRFIFLSVPDKGIEQKPLGTNEGSSRQSTTG